MDGPGIRFSIYVQGCPHRCPGCHNPETHDPRGGYEISLDQLTALIDRSSYGLNGVTISGGEPFEQASLLADLAVEILARGLNLVLYSGYTFETLLLKSQTDQDICFLLKAGRLLVDGPFIQEVQDLSLAYRGSRNQRLIDLPESLHNHKAVEWAGSLISSR